MTTDRSGRKSYQDYDPMKRLVREQDAAGNSVQYEYDAMGNRVKLIDGKGNLTRWSYDKLNRPSRKSYADGGYEENAYNYWGLPGSKRNARGQVTNYSYDLNNNPTLVDYQTMADVTLSYDAANRVTQMTDGLGTTTYGRDVASRVTSIDGPLLNDTVSYGYDTLGRRSTLRVNGVDGANYGYDTLDRLSSVTSAAGTFSYGYAGNTGMVSQLSRPNGTVTANTYDALQRLTGVGNRKADTSLISGYSYGYNTRDVRTYVESQVGTNPIQRINYGYDTIDQVTSEVSTEAQPQVNTSYAYDAMGNRSSAQASGTYTGSYSSSNTANKLNQLTGYATTSGGTTNTRNLSYDAAGNLTRQTLSGGATNGGTTYSYDEENRLTQVMRANETTGVNEGKSEFVYDGL